MSLLMLKTKDLTHQDHILNFELMLNPTRSGLLLNKHRSLESKRDKEKEICEVERQFAINHFHVEKRMIERRRKLLLEQAAKRTYYRDSPVSSKVRPQEPLEIELSDEDEDSDDWDSFPRSRSASTRQGKVNVKGKSTRQVHNRAWMSNSSKSTRPTTGSSYNRRPVCSVELEPRPQTTAGGRQRRQPTSNSTSNQKLRGKAAVEEKEHVPFARRPNAFVSQSTSSAVSGRKETNAWQSPSKTDTSGKASVTFMTQTDPQHHQETEHSQEQAEDISQNSPFITALNTEKQNTAEIKTRVGQFLTKVEDFKSRPQSHDREIRAESPWIIRTGKKTTSATVAKRYNQLSLDIKKLHSAFDKLCVERNPEELQKMVKLASKLKANVKYARNVSFVPVIGTLKSGKRFKENALSVH